MADNNFELSEEQAMILDSVRKLAEDVAAPAALHADEHWEFVRSSYDGLAELGLFGMAVSEDGGGAGLGYLSLAVAVEESARACGSTARLLMTQAGCCALALDGLADGAELLEGVMTGETLCGFVGADAGLCAEGDNLTGTAEMVTGGMEAGAFLCVADTKDGPALFSVAATDVQREALQALGFRAAAPARISFAAVSGKRLASGADATAAIARAKLAALIGGAALGVGCALGASEHARRHASERIAFGKPLLGQPAVQHKLVESRRRSEGARHLVFHAARLADSGQDGTEAAMLAKLSAIDAAVLASDEAVQIHGGYGYVVEYHVERHYREAKTIEVLDGGTDALRDALAVSGTS